MTSPAALPASFRDPSGFVFCRDGELLRQVNRRYGPDYDRLMGSGLYEALVEAGQLVPHDEVDLPPLEPARAHRVLRPEPVPFVSYPYEWCFGQLKAAAELTLAIQERALAFGMTLKDASAYNVQFKDGHPVLIDTLSFERYREGRPWTAYRQFCQHFLAPLALMSYRDARLGGLLRVHLDGIPLDLSSALLPARTRLRPGLLAHLHLHARSQARYADRPASLRGRKLSPVALRGLIDHLCGTLRRLRWRPRGAGWADYEARDSYAPEALERKRALVGELLGRLRPRTVWDLGANRGAFSRLAAEQGSRVVAFDLDPAAVERHHRACRAREESRVLPLWLDLANPSPGLGWHHRERDALLARGPANVALALALVHHLALGHNVPLPHVAAFFKDLCRALVVEFVPKDDPQAQRLLAARADVFDDYTQEAFEAAFGAHFTLEERWALPSSRRVLYHLRAKRGSP